MNLFLSTYTNKIDKKGRISVPANFRNCLPLQKFNGIIAYSSFINQCIEACSIERIERLSDSIDDLDPFSDEHDAFTTSILGSSIQLPFDSEGRITLPESLINDAGLSEKAVFVGKGKTFEIWQPELFTKHSAKARDIAKNKRHQLRLKFSTQHQESDK